METEICEMCRSVLNEIEKPEGMWRVEVIRAAGQPNISVVYLDHEVRIDGRIKGRFAKFGVHRPAWEKQSQDEKLLLLRERIQEAIRNMTNANV
jgi:hypothetical protein